MIPPEPPPPLAIAPEPPVFRPLKVYAFDSSLGRRSVPDGPQILPSSPVSKDRCRPV
jgi:hypothetical protein